MKKSTTTHLARQALYTEKPSLMKNTKMKKTGHELEKLIGFKLHNKR